MNLKSVRLVPFFPKHFVNDVQQSRRYGNAHVSVGNNSKRDDCGRQIKSRIRESFIRAFLEQFLAATPQPSCAQGTACLDRQHGAAISQFRGCRLNECGAVERDRLESF
jgi:hypothetical protein